MNKLYKKIKNKSKIKESGRQYISIIKYNTYQIEMLFVLSTLLGCKRKCEIQDKLANYGIIDLLNNYIDYLEWGNIFIESNRPYFDINEVNFQDDTAYHGKGCKCDTDTALKIQYLRFIYTFCCRDNNNVTNKLNLLSHSDMQNFLCPGYTTIFYFHLAKFYNKYKNDTNVKFNKMFQKFFSYISENFNEPYSTKINSNFSNYFLLDDNIKNEFIQNIVLTFSGLENNLENILNLISLYNSKEEKIGLLHKLILKYIQECQHSSSKFWLASCIEVMVRGNNTFLQTFTASTGLIPYLLYDIIYSQYDQLQILQLSFDILGEVIKFNKANFLLLNYYFVDNNEFQAFTKKVISKEHLVDSNVFLRSIIISSNFFDQEDDNLKLNSENYFSKNCKFCIFLEECHTQVFYLLIQTVKPDDINQTNISCINTALLILILKYLKNKLADFLTVK